MHSKNFLILLKHCSKARTRYDYGIHAHVPTISRYLPIYTYKYVPIVSMASSNDDEDQICGSENGLGLEYPIFVR